MSILTNLIPGYDRMRQGLYTNAPAIKVKDTPEQTIKLNDNTSSVAAPNMAGLNRYPDKFYPSSDLLQKAAAHYNVNPDHILITNGTDRSIDHLTRIFCQGWNDSIITCPPAFSMYRASACANRAGMVDVPLKETFNEQTGLYSLELNYAGIVEKVNAQAKSLRNIAKKLIGKEKRTPLIFITSPNSPDGGVTPTETIRKLCKDVEGKAAVVVDEAYIEYAKGQQSMAAFLEDHPNLIVLRPLSKAHALAGARIGFALCADNEFVSFMRKIIPPYDTPQPSIDLAVKAFSAENLKFSGDNTQNVTTEREKLKNALKGRPDICNKVYDSQGNFVLIEAKDPVKLFTNATMAGIQIRHLASENMPHHFRITVGTQSENKALLDAILSLE